MMHFLRTGLLFFVFLAGFEVQAALDVDVGCESALLINSNTGRVLFAKNASKAMYPASCTKVAFALYAIKYHQALFNKTLVCSQNALKSMHETHKSKSDFATHPSYILEHDASHMGLKVGEAMRFYDLLEATMVVSADDASNVLAEAMGGGSIEKCVQDVNNFVASIGCKNSHFTNPHGLHHPDHTMTAQDLALLCREAMKEPLFALMARKTRFQRPRTNKQQPVVLQQTNRMLVKGSPYYYPAVRGIKTGYHRRAGHCLAAFAEKNGRALISVVLHNDTKEGRYQDTKKLFEAAFQETQISRELLASGPQSFEREVDGGSCPIKTTTKEPLVYSFYPSEEPVARCQLTWQKVNLPLSKGTPVGELALLADGEVVQKTKLFAANDVERTFTSALRERLNLPLLIGLSGIILIGLLLLLKKRK